MELVTLDEFSLRSLILAGGGMLRTDGLSFIIALHGTYIFYSSEPIPGRPNLDFSYSDDALRRRSIFEPHWPFAKKF